jgi:hypothetical protein
VRFGRDQRQIDCKQCIDCVLSLPDRATSLTVALTGRRCWTRSSHSASGSPTFAHVSVWTKSTSRTALDGIVRDKQPRTRASGELPGQRNDISQRRRGTPVVGKAVPHRDAGVLGESLHGLLGEAPERDSVAHATGAADGVPDRLVAASTAITRR